VKHLALARGQRLWVGGCVVVEPVQETGSHHGGEQRTAGMVFTLYDGRAFWDRAGKARPKKYYEAGGTCVAMREGNSLRWLLSDHHEGGRSALPPLWYDTLQQRHDTNQLPLYGSTRRSWFGLVLRQLR
jgi:hypothetical protein